MEEQSRVREILETSRKELREKLLALSAGAPNELKPQIENVRRLLTHEWLAADLLIEIAQDGRE